MPPKFRLRIDAMIEQPGFSAGSLHISESLDLEANDFLGLCEILAQFHKLAETLRAKTKIGERL